MARFGNNYLPRLAREHYQGDTVVHWTLPLMDRATGWLGESFHSRFRELMLHAAAREALVCPAYSLMPDHIHLIWMGLRLDSDQLNGMSFLRTHLKAAVAPARFQKQAHDHVLRDEDRQRGAFARLCGYVLNNPVRAELVEEPARWPYSGAIVPGYPSLQPLNGEYWEKFWRLYQQLRQPEAGNIRRPPMAERLTRSR